MRVGHLFCNVFIADLHRLKKNNKTTPLVVKTTRAVVVFILELILHRLRLFAGKQKTNKKTTQKGGFFIGSGCLIGYSRKRVLLVS